MAYMSKEHAKEIRDELKATFKNTKFSIRIDNHSALHVAILSAPDYFVDEAVANYRANLSHEFKPSGVPAKHADINQYHIDSFPYKHKDVLKKMLAIINKRNWDKSDIQTDYFDVGFYLTLSQGKWDKNFELKQPKGK
jgi:hypothetical protein